MTAVARFCARMLASIHFWYVLCGIFMICAAMSFVAAIMNPSDWASWFMTGVDVVLAGGSRAIAQYLQFNTDFKQWLSEIEVDD